MELAQRAYLTAEAPPWAYDPDRAATLRATLAACLSDLDRIARSGALS
jgi:N-formylglutamate deformylase